MWPWEHVIVGYVAFSLFSHLVYREGPSAGATVAVVFASLLPDLIDKPLAWQFGVFDGGYAIGHSIFFAVPLSILVGVLAHRWGRTHVGLAFCVGYLLHLPSDLLPQYVRDGTVPTERILWPIERAESPDHGGLVDGFFANFLPYLTELGGMEPTPYLYAQFGLAGFALLLWIYDGMPVVRELLVGTHRRISEVEES
ncbi:MAG: metal-dependent hydrolase [Halalkalicoccus sp.]